VYTLHGARTCTHLVHINEAYHDHLTAFDTTHSGSSASYFAISSSAYAAALRVSHTLIRNKGHIRATRDARISTCDLYMCASCSAADVRANVDAPDEMMASNVSRRVFCFAESWGAVCVCVCMYFVCMYVCI
jgi:hypothetical protein